MTVNLPKDVEQSIEAAVRGGHFASVDDAMAQAARLLLRQIGQPETVARPIRPDPILGVMRDDFLLMDEIVTDTYLQRRSHRA